MNLNDALTCMSIIRSALPNADQWTEPGLNGSILLIVTIGNIQECITSTHKCGLFLKKMLAANNSLKK
jgi:hypothetical protein